MTVSIEAGGAAPTMRQLFNENCRLTEVIKAKDAEIAALREALRWIPVEEKFPPRHTHVLCLNRDGYVFEGCICMGMHKPFFTYPRGDGSPSNTAPNWIDVTHWMFKPPVEAESALASAPKVINFGPEDFEDRFHPNGLGILSKRLNEVTSETFIGSCDAQGISLASAAPKLTRCLVCEEVVISDDGRWRHESLKIRDHTAHVAQSTPPAPIKREDEGDWPFIREQFKIEFGRDMHTDYGGMIMNLMMSIHELVEAKAQSTPPQEEGRRVHPDTCLRYPKAAGLSEAAPEKEK